MGAMIPPAHVEGETGLEPSRTRTAVKLAVLKAALRDARAEVERWSNSYWVAQRWLGKREAEVERLRELAAHVTLVCTCEFPDDEAIEEHAQVGVSRLRQYLQEEECRCRLGFSGHLKVLPEKHEGPCRFNLREGE